jgi:uncharacterized protein (TIGR00369 family)
VIDIATLQSALGEVFAPWVQRLHLEVHQAGDGEVLVELPVAAEHVHAGGVLCGQTLMAAADTAMVLAVMTKLGGFKPMTTVQMQSSFLRPVAGDATHVMLRARVLRMGRTIVFGEIHVLAPDGALAAQATTTYALL